MHVELITILVIKQDSIAARQACSVLQGSSPHWYVSWNLFILKWGLLVAESGENGGWKEEDYMLFDPFINRVADLHDRHRDMRLDVDNMSYEDYMLFDPFINGVANLHDRHRDMRLDVDNMSYEHQKNVYETLKLG
uniref:RING-type E3 ubiquitin transferase n=1 Tax=Tanacetum cinerariifolium TaxID=118510 RepID=A0A6L2K6G8_TANCI|nr:hypothetical protein [Tanacetum cinerariifolium]